MKYFKHFRYIKLVFALLSIIQWQDTSSKPAKKCFITLTSLWQELEQDNVRIEQCGGKPTLIAHIALKKRSKEPAQLKSLHFQWNGNPLTHVAGSLYNKEPEKSFLPIQKYLVSDSIWNKREQRLIFNFNATQNASINSSFYLVLQLTPELIATMQNGTLTLIDSSLPRMFKGCSYQQKITF